MEYLYGEMQSAEKKSLETHLKGCAPCRAAKNEFTGTMETLDTWEVKLPAKHSLADARHRFQPVVKWAAAAALLVSTAFAAGRFSRPDVAALQAQISAQVESNLKSELQAPLEQRFAEQMEVATERAALEAKAKVDLEIAARLNEISMRARADAVLAAEEQIEQLSITLSALREEDRQRMTTALKAIETQWLTENRKMREDLERVAVFSDESYRIAQRQLVQLASYNQTNLEPSNKDN
jgi:hypothetical protein